jgi:hypothetical protein
LTEVVDLNAWISDFTTVRDPSEPYTDQQQEAICCCTSALIQSCPMLQQEATVIDMRSVIVIVNVLAL